MMEPSAFSNDSFEALAGCSSLVSFSLTCDCPPVVDDVFSHISEEYVEMLVTNCTKLTKLHISCL